MSPAVYPISDVSIEFAARSEESGSAHKMYKSFYVAQAHMLRVLANRSSGDVAAGYKKLSMDAARFAAVHHKLARMEVGK